MFSKKRINKFLKRFNVELHGISYLQSLKKGEFKNNEFDFFKRVFPSASITIFDVGANRGLKTTEFINLFPSASIYAFEPYLPLFEELEKRFQHNKKIHLYNIGISNEKGNSVFNVNTGLDTSSFLNSNKTGLNSDAQVQTIQELVLPLTTLDHVVSEEHIDRINILKMDIQGSELNALKGAEKLLIENKIDIIFTETYFIQQYIAQPLFYEIASFLLSYGYVLQDMYNPVYGKGKIAWCDVIFVRKDLIC